MNDKDILERLISTMEEGVIVVDRQGFIVYFNESSLSITGCKAKEVIGKNVHDVFVDIPLEKSSFHQVLTSRRPIFHQVQQYINAKGETVSALSSTVPIFNEKEIDGAIEIFKDLTQVSQLAEKIRLMQDLLHGKQDSSDLSPTNGTRYTLRDLIGQSRPMDVLKQRIEKVAQSDAPVFVYGETGTGKELVVQSIHNASNRRQQPFIAQNCAALPAHILESLLFGTAQGSFTGALNKPGLFELADGGTLFLDEINSLEIGLQSKLLRVLDDGMIRRLGSSKTQKVNVRVIAAVNEAPSLLLEQGRLREDLFFRLNVLNVDVPALRERKEDIPLLVDSFIKRIAKRSLAFSVQAIDEQALEFLLSHNWSGNVRELRNWIERAVHFAEGSLITLEDMSLKAYPSKVYDLQTPDQASTLPQKTLKEQIEQFEKEQIEQALRKCGYVSAKAARYLGIPKQTLHNKCKKYQIYKNKKLSQNLA